jgi:hypothetical protein
MVASFNARLRRNELPKQIRTEKAPTIKGRGKLSRVELSGLGETVVGGHGSQHRGKRPRPEGDGGHASRGR